jgi:hypothetical protein
MSCLLETGIGEMIDILQRMKMAKGNRRIRRKAVVLSEIFIPLYRYTKPPVIPKDR